MFNSFLKKKENTICKYIRTTRAITIAVYDNSSVYKRQDVFGHSVMKLKIEINLTNSVY